MRDFGALSLALRIQILRETSSQPRDWKSGPEKRHKHKEFRQKPPPPRPPSKGAPDPCKFFMLGASLPFKTQGKAKA